MLSKMKEKRRWKSKRTKEGNSMLNKKLNNKLRRETDRAREEW